MMADFEPTLSEVFKEAGLGLLSYHPLGLGGGWLSWREALELGKAHRPEPGGVSRSFSPAAH